MNKSEPQSRLRPSPRRSGFGHVGGPSPRRLRGIVVSDKMKKTAVVAVHRMKLHPKYKKHYRVARRFKVHDPENAYHVGDAVVIEETRPLSRDKRWRIIGRTTEM